MRGHPREILCSTFGLTKFFPWLESNQQLIISGVSNKQFKITLKKTSNSNNFILVLGFWLNYVFHFFFSGIFTLIELCDWPKFMHKYKIQPGTNENVTVKRVFQVSLLFVLIFKSILLILKFLKPLTDCPSGFL